MRKWKTATLFQNLWQGDQQNKGLLIEGGTTIIETWNFFIVLYPGKYLWHKQLINICIFPQNLFQADRICPKMRDHTAEKSFFQHYIQEAVVILFSHHPCFSFAHQDGFLSKYVSEEKRTSLWLSLACKLYHENVARSSFRLGDVICFVDYLICTISFPCDILFYLNNNPLGQALLSSFYRCVSWDSTGFFDFLERSTA